MDSGNGARIVKPVLNASQAIIIQNQPTEYV